MLTRLPTPLRLDRPVVDAELVGPDGPATWALVGEAAATEVIGGAVYDFHSASCARRANAAELATFNRRHFERLGLAGLPIVVPGTYAG